MDNYFYIDEYGAQIGPSSLAQLTEGQYLKPETLVWNHGMKNWQRADSIDHLRGCIQPIGHFNTPPPINGEQGGAAMPNNTPQKPDNWMIWNILVVFFCCFITGIIGIYYSNKVDDHWFMGRHTEARKAADTAKKLFIASIILGTSFIVGYIVLILIGVSMIGVSSF